MRMAQWVREKALGFIIQVTGFSRTLYIRIWEGYLHGQSLFDFVMFLHLVFGVYFLYSPSHSGAFVVDTLLSVLSFIEFIVPIIQVPSLMHHIIAQLCPKFRI